MLEGATQLISTRLGTIFEPKTVATTKVKLAGRRAGDHLKLLRSGWI